MPQFLSVGPKHFVQVITQPLEWEGKLLSKGWRQEIEPPYRYSTPTLIRLITNKILVIGKWEGTKLEEEALNSAVSRRDLTYDDFQEEKGWIPAPDQDTEENL
jgi:hypothetical protein